MPPEAITRRGNSTTHASNHHLPPQSCCYGTAHAKGVTTGPERTSARASSNYLHIKITTFSCLGLEGPIDITTTQHMCISASHAKAPSLFWLLVHAEQIAALFVVTGILCPLHAVIVALLPPARGAAFGQVSVRAQHWLPTLPENILVVAILLIPGAKQARTGTSTTPQGYLMGA